jgi:translation initiation factor 1 (eIF-1/SUI1)
MNPFEKDTDNTITNKSIMSNDRSIEIWVETKGRKKNTYVSEWNLSLEQLKDHLKIIKKKNGCNGTIKEDPDDVSGQIRYILQLQGDHIDFIHNYLKEQHIDPASIIIKG